VRFYLMTLSVAKIIYILDGNRVKYEYEALVE
jgi:hypothetical protein